ncbi:MAG: hypothetical protein JNM34_05005, partial [Chthonomonadaceae bacterium]|nr:hypothetical protein [Chthonomonadaceae bacterium]
GITEDGVIGGFVNPTWDGLNAGRPFVWSAQFGLKYIGYEGQYGVPTQFGKSGSDYEMSGNGQGNNAYPWLWIGSADPLGKGAVLDASAFQGPDQVAMMFTGFNPGDTGCFGGWIYTNIGLWASASTATALYDRYLLDPQNSNAVFVARGTVSSGGVNEALKPDATLLRVKASTADPESPLDPVTVEFQTTVPLTNHKNAFHCTARVNTNGLFAYHVEVFDWSINDWEVTGQAYMPSNFLTYNVFGGDLTLNGRKNYVRQTDGAVKARLRVKQVGSGPISQNWVVEVDQANWCYDKRTTE